MGLQDELAEAGYDIVGICPTAASAIATALATQPDLILMDVRLRGDRDGVDAAMAVESQLPQTKIIFLTGSREDRTIERIRRDHPDAILYKPVAPEALKAAIIAALTS